LGEGERGSIGTRKFLHHWDALAAFRCASEGSIDVGYAALLLLANGTNLTIGKAIANTDVHSIHPPSLRLAPNLSYGGM